MEIDIPTIAENCWPTDGRLKKDSHTFFNSDNDVANHRNRTEFIIRNELVPSHTSKVLYHFQTE